jgi:dolichol-phosphate mannosyltransferase
VRLLVVLPTYDEAANVERTVRGVRRAVPDAQVLVVDDASPDGTGQLADGLAAADAAVHVLHRPAKQGLGAAYRAGFRWGMHEGFDVIAQMDADGSHQPEQLPGLLSALAPGVDLVIGSRWVPDGRILHWPRHRELLSRGGNAYARRALGTDVRDVTAGYRVWRTGTLVAMDLDRVRAQGYCFQVDMLRTALGAGSTVVEMPITFVERTAGESKMSARIVAEALWLVSWWGIERGARRVRRQYGPSGSSPTQSLTEAPTEAPTDALRGN